MKFSLRLAVLLLGQGNNFDLIKRMDRATQQDLIQKGLSLLLPMCLAVLSAFAFSTQTLGLKLGTSVLAGLGFSIIILWLDRTFLNTTKDLNNGEKRLRYALAILIAFISTLGIDMFLYQNDIKEEMRVMANERTSPEIEHAREELAGFDQMISNKQAEAEAMKDAYLNEMRTGVGSRARAKNRLYEELATQERELIAQRDQHVAALAQLEAAYQDEMVREINKSMLLKVKAVFNVVFSSRKSISVWLAIFLLIVLMDTVPVRMKNNDKNGYDLYLIQQTAKARLMYAEPNLDQSRKMYEQVKSSIESQRNA